MAKRKFIACRVAGKTRDGRLARDHTTCNTADALRYKLRYRVARSSRLTLE